MQFTLRWPVYHQVELVERPDPGGGATKTALNAIKLARSERLWVRSVVQEPEMRSPFAIDGLYHHLAKCSSATDVCDFVQTFGFLRKGKQQKLLDFYKEVDAMRSCLAGIERGDWDLLRTWFAEQAEYRAIGVVASLEYEKARERPTVFFQPRDLISAVYLQLFSDAETGAQLKHCARPGCGNWFKYGPGTGRRVTADYCGWKCQKAHQYAQSKEK